MHYSVALWPERVAHKLGPLRHIGMCAHWQSARKKKTQQNYIHNLIRIECAVYASSLLFKDAHICVDREHI